MAARRGWRRRGETAPAPRLPAPCRPRSPRCWRKQQRPAQRRAPTRPSVPAAPQLRPPPPQRPGRRARKASPERRLSPCPAAKRDPPRTTSSAHSAARPAAERRTGGPYHAAARSAPNAAILAAAPCGPLVSPAPPNGLGATAAPGATPLGPGWPRRPPVPGATRDGETGPAAATKKRCPGWGTSRVKAWQQSVRPTPGAAGKQDARALQAAFSPLVCALPFFLIHRPFYPASAVFTDTAQKRSGRGKQSLWMCSIEEMERGEPGLLLRASLKQYERFLQSLHFTENFQKASVDVEHLSDFPSVTSSRFGAQPRARLCRPHR